MAKISRKKKIIRERIETFHARPSKKQKIIRAIAIPAKAIHEAITSDRGKKVIGGIGSFLKGWGEAASAAQQRQYGYKSTSLLPMSKKRKTKKARK